MGFTFVGDAAERKQEKGAKMGTAYVLCPHCYELSYTFWRCTGTQASAAYAEYLKKEPAYNACDLCGKESDYPNFGLYYYHSMLSFIKDDLADFRRQFKYLIPADIQKSLLHCCKCGKKINFTLKEKQLNPKGEVYFEKYQENRINNPKELQKVYDKLMEKLQEEQELITHEEKRIYIKACEEKHILTDMPKNNPTANRVTESPELLKQYIKYLLETEIKLHCAHEHRQNLKLQQLRCKAAQIRLEANQQIEEDQALQKIKDKGAEKLVALLAAYTVPQPEKPTKIILDKADLPPKPRKPACLQTGKPVPPEKPEYKNPGFFNRKKIEKENSELAELYHRQQEKYLEDLQKYLCTIEKYEKAIKERDAEIERKQREVESANQQLEQEYRQQLEEYQKQKANYEQQCIRQINDETEQQAQLLREEIAQSQKQATNNTAASNETKTALLVSDELSMVEKHIDMLINTRNTLLAYNVIFPKYRSVNILYVFLEYLDSGRCTTLSGADGAYNIYEQEVRADMIIAKLDELGDILNVINEKQTLLYEEMRATRQQTEQLSASLAKAVEEMQSGNVTLNNLLVTEEEVLATQKETRSLSEHLVLETSKVSRKMDKVAENTAMSAHYSKVTAFYSKQAAETAKALGFMVALT